MKPDAPNSSAPSAGACSAPLRSGPLFSLRKLLALFFFALLLPASAAPNILIEGWDGVFWQNINDGDLDANQQVTDFDTVDFHQSKDRLYRIRNTNNNDTLTVTVNANSPGSTSSQFTFPDFPSGSFPVPGNGTREFTIRYIPVTAGRTATIRIDSNSGSAGSAERIYEFAVTGQARGGIISVNYSPAGGGADVGIGNGATATVARGTDFGSLRVGGGAVADNNVERDFYVRNSSSATDPLVFESVLLGGANASQFEVVSLGQSNLSPGNNRNFKIRFNPTSTGVKTATLSIRSNDEDDYPYVVNLTGTGTALSEVRVDGKRDQAGRTFDNIADNTTTTVSAANGTLFNDTRVGSTFDAIYRIYNDGDLTLNLTNFTIAGAGASAFSVVSGGFTTASVLPGTSRDVTVRFTPPSGATFPAAVTFGTNDTNENPFNFAIQGTGLSPEIVVEGKDAALVYQDITDGGGNSPSVNNGTDFGPQDIAGGAAQRTFRISNTGNETLKITARRFIGDTDNEFNVNGLLPAIGARDVKAGEPHEFTISFDPKSEGVKNVIFEMTTDDPDEITFTFDLRGTGIGFPEVRVQGRRQNVVGATFTEIMDNDNTPRSADGTLFNDTEVGQTFLTIYRISNDGDGALRISNFRLTGSPSFAFWGTPDTSDIPPKGERDIEVRFVPTAGATVSSVLSFDNNDTTGGESTFNFTIQGTGLASEIAVLGRGAASQFGLIPDGDTTPRIPDGTDFDTTAIGATETYQFRIDNTGNKVLKITARDFIGDTESEFSVSGLLSLGVRNIDPGQSHFFDISFTPKNVGVETVTFTMTNDDPNEDPYNFVLRAEGVGTPEIQVRGLTSTGIPFDINDGDLNPNQDVTDFGKVDLHTAKARTYRIVNDGTDVLNITSAESSDPHYVISGLNRTIAAGSSDDFTITLTPTEVDNDIRSTITIVSDATVHATYTFAVTGEGEGAVITVLGGPTFATTITDGDTSPAETDGTLFPGRAPASGSATTTFKITNTGNKTLNIKAGTAVTGTDASSFSISRLNAGNPFVDIPAGGSDFFDVTFDPTKVGVLNAVIDLETNVAGTTAHYTFAVRGIGLDPASIPDIELRGLSNRVITAGNPTPSTLTGTDFGTIAPGGAAITRTFRIANLSPQSTLTVSAVTLTQLGPESFTLGNFPTSIAPGSSQPFTVTLNPAAATGTRAAIVTVSSDDPDTSSYSFNISGVVEAPVGDPHITSFTQEGNDIVITLDAPAGATYRVTTSTTLAPGSWTAVSGQTGLSSGTIRLSNVITPGTSGKRFWRVEQE